MCGGTQGSSKQVAPIIETLADAAGSWGFLDVQGVFATAVGARLCDADLITYLSRSVVQKVTLHQDALQREAAQKRDQLALQREAAQRRFVPGRKQVKTKQEFKDFYGDEEGERIWDKQGAENAVGLQDLRKGVVVTVAKDLPGSSGTSGTSKGLKGRIEDVDLNKDKKVIAVRVRFDNLEKPRKILQKDFDHLIPEDKRGA